MLNTQPIMLAQFLMLFSTDYAQNYAGIIGQGLPTTLQNTLNTYRYILYVLLGLSVQH